MLLLALLAAGCEREDGERLTRVGWKVTEKMEGAIPEHTPFDGPLLASSPEMRVQNRFRADKYLAPWALTVTGSGGTVTLSGSISEDYHDWAVNLAKSTLGVEEVTDSLTIR